MCKDIFRTETQHEETFRDLTTPPSFSDLSLALLAEFEGEFIASLQAFSGDVKMIHANYWHCALLRYGSVERAEPSAFNALFAPRSKWVVIDSVSLHFLLAGLGRTGSMTSRRDVFVLRIVYLHFPFSQRVLEWSQLRHSPSMTHIVDRGTLAIAAWRLLLVGIWSYGS